MQTFLFQFLCAILIAASAKAADDWQTLFNGKDLTGWRANLYPDSWSVVNGTIRAHATTASSHLFFVGQEPSGKFVSFTNFVLELSARSERNANSGIFFHTGYKTRTRANYLDSGYEVQLNSTAKEPRKTGSLYAVVDLDKSPVNEAEWFRVRITVEGKHITVHLNDQTVVDYIEPQNVERPPDRVGRKINPAGGAIALQGHDPKSTFYFKLSNAWDEAAWERFTKPGNQSSTGLSLLKFSCVTARMGPTSLSLIDSFVRRALWPD